MPVAMITTSHRMSRPPLKRSRVRAPRSSIRVTAAPVRTSTPWRRSQPSTSSAPVGSIIRGRMRGAISTIVSRAPSARIEFKIVNAMKPAPIMTTWLPGAMWARTPRASSSVQNEWTRGPSAPGTGARTADDPVATRQSSYSIFVPSSSVQTPARVSRAAARRPRWVFTLHSARTAAVAVKTCDSAIDRSR